MLEKIIHGDGQRFAPEAGEEAPMAEQFARLQYLVEHCDLSEKKVLDCGCGTGYSLPIVAANFPTGHYVGIDMEKGAIDYARQRYKNLHFAVMNGRCLAFSPSCFDVVLSFEVLEHLSKKQQEEYVREMHRVLKPDGMIILSTPNKEVFSLGYENSLNLYHIAERTLSELSKLLGETFASMEIYGQYFDGEDLRRKDKLQIESKFTLKKRMKRYAIRWIINSPIAKPAYDMYEATKAKVLGKRKVYPFEISASDFKFDKTHLDDSKWFFCVCRK